MYWTRRVLVLAVAFGLVFAVARLIGTTGLSEPTATPIGSTPSVSTTTAEPTPTSLPSGPTASSTPKSGKGTKQPAASETPLAIPDGPCADDDIQVTPEVKKAYAGQDVEISLAMTTIESAACTWRVMPTSVVVKLTSGDDRIWSTQDCPAAVPTEPVVLRHGEVTRVAVTWSGQRSAGGTCSRTTAWAMPGYYHVEAAALGSDPLDVQFELESPVRPTVTATPKSNKHRD